MSDTANQRHSPSRGGMLPCECGCGAEMPHSELEYRLRRVSTTFWPTAGPCLRDPRSFMIVYLSALPFQHQLDRFSPSGSALARQQMCFDINSFVSTPSIVKHIVCPTTQVGSNCPLIRTAYTCGYLGLAYVVQYMMPIESRCAQCSTQTPIQMHIPRCAT